MKTIRVWTVIVSMSLMLCGQLLFAADAPVETTSWTTKDLTGKEVRVPVEGKPTIVLFLMADQTRSKEAMDQVCASLNKNGGIAAFQAIAVLSGDDAVVNAKRLADEKKWVGQIVADIDFSLTNKMNVHVWPTTEIVSAKGERIIHIPSLPISYIQELEAHMAFAAGKIDKTGLAKRLEDHGIIADSPQQLAHRHLRVAQQLIEQGESEQARAELTLALKQQPGDAELLLNLANVDITLGQPDKALEEIANVTLTGPDWTLQQVRGRALIAKGQWDQAGPLLEKAVKLNPKPAEARYLLALVYQHQGDLAKAAQLFRAAFENTPVGKRTIVKVSEK